MHHHIEHLLATYGYWGLYAALAIEYLFVPVPGETTLTAAGIIGLRPAYHMSLVGLILATGMGTFTGTMFAYAVGRTFGRPALERFGKYIRLTPERIDKAGALFAKYTLPTLFFSRYIAGVRIIIPYIAGINRVRLIIYIPMMLFSSLVWTATFILAGSGIEKAWGVFKAHWQTYLLPAILVLAALIAAYVVFHRWMNRKMEQVGADDNTSATQDADSHKPGH